MDRWQSTGRIQATGQEVVGTCNMAMDVAAGSDTKSLLLKRRLKKDGAGWMLGLGAVESVTE